MTNAFGAVLDSASLRRATIEGVSETVIAANYLLHERSVDEIVAKLQPSELEQVINAISCANSRNFSSPYWSRTATAYAPKSS
jgi:hypothetical protein